jgi:hypothetical protein
LRHLKTVLSRSEFIEARNAVNFVMLDKQEFDNYRKRAGF